VRRSAATASRPRSRPSLRARRQPRQGAPRDENGSCQPPFVGENVDGGAPGPAQTIVAPAGGTTRKTPFGNAGLYSIDRTFIVPCGPTRFSTKPVSASSQSSK